MPSVYVSAAIVALLGSVVAVAQTASAASTPPDATAAGKPTLYLVGDSTVNNNANGGQGWGTPIARLFDPTKITVKNSARGGRSARSYYSEGLWDAVKASLKPGDFVLFQFGTNDGPGNQQQILSSTNGRPDLAGVGDETIEGPDSSAQHKMETVHTYGWYMHVYLTDTQAKGATPVLLNPVPHNQWAAGKVRRVFQGTFDKWCAELAEKDNVFYINLDEVSATRLDKEGQETVTTKYFTPPGDGTHTNPAGATLNAESVVMGIRALKELKLNEYLSEAGRNLAPADAAHVRTVKPAATASGAAPK